jgi:hypothetical protein
LGGLTLGQLPPPLVPSDVSLGGNDWFPLYHRRLLKSRWWRIASDVARSRNVDLWCHAFEELPAGSLPDDDLELADLAGFGRDMAAFVALKSEILAPWTLCNDGRWYHPALCEVVLEVWERTDERRRKERQRQAAHRARIRGHTHGDDNDRSEGVTRDNPSLSRVTDPEVTHEGASQTDRRDKKETGASAPPLAPVKASKVEPWKADAEFLALWDAATPEMRKRAKSMRKVWPEFEKARKALEPGTIRAGMLAYRKGDPDVARTGGPGLHIWLRDRTFEQWGDDASAATAWTPAQWSMAVKLWKESGEWGETLGPAPGQPACRVPQPVLTEHGLGLRVVNGGAA